MSKPPRLVATFVVVIMLGLSASAGAGNPLSIDIHSNTNHFTLSPDGKFLASIIGRGIKVFDTSAGKQVASIKGEAAGLAFTPNGKFLVAGGAPDNNYVARVFDGANWQTKFELNGQKQSSTLLQVSDDSDRALVLDQAGTINVWDLNTGRSLATIAPGAQKGEVAAFSADGKTVYALAANNAIRTIDVATAKETGSIALNGAGFYSKVAAPTARLVETGPNLKILDLTTGQPLPLEGDAQIVGGYCYFVIISPDGKSAISETDAGFGNSLLAVWDLARATIRLRSSAPLPQTIGIWRSANGKRVCAACRDGSIRIFDASTLKEIENFPAAFRKIARGLTTNAVTLASSQDGSVIASHDANPELKERVIKIWTVPAKP